MDNQLIKDFLANKGITEYDVISARYCDLEIKSGNNYSIFTSMEIMEFIYQEAKLIKRQG